MILVFPVSAVDEQMALELLPWLAQTGPYPGHKALIVFAPEVSAEARVAIRAAFDNLGFALVKAAAPHLNHDEEGWPAGANAMFRHAAAIISGNPDYQAPWYFFEPDNVPMRKGWLDELHAEYFRDPSRPFLGVLENSWRVAKIMGTDVEQRISSGKHLVGTAMYPAHLGRYAREYLQCHGVAFDVAMQHEIVQMARHTNLIQHNWLTENYVLGKDGVVNCSAREGRLKGQKGYALARQVRLDQPAVVHGCKDGSLLRILCKLSNTNLAKVKEPVLVAAQTSPVPVPRSRRRTATTLAT